MRLNGACRARRLANAVGLVVMSWGAAGEAAPLELRWTAPPECPSNVAVVDATVARLGDAGSGGRPELLVEGTVQARDGGWVAVLVLSDASGQPIGERELRVTGQDCAAIEQPVSLVLAMVIATLRQQAPFPAHAPKSQRKPSTRAELEARPVLPRRLLVGAGATTSIGVLPDVGLGAAVRAMYSPGWLFYFGLEASFEVGGAVRIGTGEIDFQLFDGSLRVGLLALRSHRVELIPTVGARVGVIHAPSSGFARSFGGETRPTVFAGPGVLTRIRLLDDFFLEALPELEAVFVRDQFQSLEGGKLYGVHRASAVDARLSIGIGYDFR